MIGKVNRVLRDLTYEIRAKSAPVKRKVRYDIPYVCQFSVPEHAEASLVGDLDTKRDALWSESGAHSSEQYTKWAYTICGMASAAMIIDYLREEKHKPVSLAEDAASNGVYEEKDNEISGMKYQEFTDWIRKYGLKANVVSRLSLDGIRYALSNGKMVIISVNPNIRGYNLSPKNQKGGHLVVVTGYDLDDDTISVHNPSGFQSSQTQEHHTLSSSDFNKYFANRGIILSPLDI